MRFLVWVAFFAWEHGVNVPKSWYRWNCHEAFGLVVRGRWGNNAFSRIGRTQDGLGMVFFAIPLGVWSPPCKCWRLFSVSSHAYMASLL